MLICEVSDCKIVVGLVQSYMLKLGMITRENKPARSLTSRCKHTEMEKKKSPHVCDGPVVPYTMRPIPLSVYVAHELCMSNTMVCWSDDVWW